MKRYLCIGFILFVQCWCMPVYGQSFFDKFDIKAAGKPINGKQLLAKCMDVDVVFFGELHDDSLCHVAEYQLLTQLTASNKTIALGLEMLETEDQTLLNEYQENKATYQHFEASANLWGNWDTDYKPIFNAALEKKIPIYATNVPRRYASLVAKRGFGALDSLSEQARAWICPLPIEVPYQQSSYQVMRKMMGGHQEGNDKAMDRFVAAQALKDATMAYIIVKNRPTGGILLHINGSFHSDYNQGILTFLKKLDPRTRTLTISFRRKENEDATNVELADVVIIAN